MSSRHMCSLDDSGVITECKITDHCVHTGPVGSRGRGCEDPSGHQGFERGHITQSKQRDLGCRFTDLCGTFLDSKLSVKMEM